MTHKYINLPVNPYKGCWYLCEGGKVLRELPPHFFHHWKEVQKYTLASFNTIVISGERTHLAVATGYSLIKLLLLGSYHSYNGLIIASHLVKHLKFSYNHDLWQLHVVTTE